MTDKQIESEVDDLGLVVTVYRSKCIDRLDL